MPHEGHSRNQNENKLKFGNTKLGLPNLNEAKSKEGHPLLIHSFSSLNPSFVYPTSPRQQLTKKFYNSFGQRWICIRSLILGTIHFVVVAMMFCSPLLEWMDVLYASKKDIQSFYGTSSQFKSVFSLVWEVLQFDPLLVKTKGIDVKYSRSRDLMVYCFVRKIFTYCAHDHVTFPPLLFIYLVCTICKLVSQIRTHLKEWHNWKRNGANKVIFCFDE